MYTIRALLDFLDADAIERLCEIRDLSGRGRDAKCEALARSYRGNHHDLFEELRKEDLVALLTDPTELDDGDYYSLPSARSYSKDQLVRIALRTLRDEVASRELVVDEDDEGYDDVDDDYDLEDRVDHRGVDYAREFWRDVNYSAEDAAKGPHPYQERAVQAVVAALHPAQPQLLHLATGGGKTRVANDILVSWKRSRGGPVLWVTKDWRLLKQAVRDLSRRYQQCYPARLGGDGQLLHPLPDGGGDDVVYTTIQTMSRRLRDGVLRDLKPKLLVWDECHWGEHGQAGKIITACKQAGIPVLGLTATPREESRFRIAYSRTFKELVDDDYLADPILELPVRTGVPWTPQFSGRFGDVTRASLDDLALSPRRNERIVEHYARNAGKYRKTIVFACNIGHVDLLSRLFAQSGISARAMHSEQDDSWNRQALEDFKVGAVQVLVNVEMLTHGIDVPDAQTVFLCRPTTSDILFAQMVGRAARRDARAGKTSFFVVEFTDNVTQHGELFESAQRYFAGSGFPSATPARAARLATPIRRASEHGFDPTGAPTWIPDDPALPESIRGLWFRQGQTFGIEFELTAADGSVPDVGPDWIEKAERLRRLLDAVLPGLVAHEVIPEYLGSEGGKDSSVWNIEHDASAGWEVTSRVLANRDGFLEVDTACRALDAAAAQLGMRVSHRTGTHVHIGWLGRDIDEVKRAIEFARLFEPALATLIAPSRVVHFSDDGRYDVSRPNLYCQPVSTVFSASVLGRTRTLEDLRRIAEAEDARYVTFNVRPLAHLHTVEVRMHHGTLEAQKILLWVSLWQQLLWAAAHRGEPQPVPDIKVIRPDKDILRLAVELFPDARQPQQMLLLRRLSARRAEIRDRQWKRTTELAAWVAIAEQWADLHFAQDTTPEPMRAPDEPAASRAPIARCPHCAQTHTPFRVLRDGSRVCTVCGRSQGG